MLTRSRYMCEMEDSNTEAHISMSLQSRTGVRVFGKMTIRVIRRRWVKLSLKCLVAESWRWFKKIPAHNCWFPLLTHNLILIFLVTFNGKNQSYLLLSVPNPLISLNRPIPDTTSKLPTNCMHTQLTVLSTTAPSICCKQKSNRWQWKKIKRPWIGWW